jgi:Calcineurin-like phosphoesterase
MPSSSLSSSSSLTPEQRALLESKEREIAILQERCATLSFQLQNALQQQPHTSISGGSNSDGNFTPHNGVKKQHYPLSPHVINVREVPVPQPPSATTTSSSSGSNHHSLNAPSQPSSSSSNYKTITMTQRERIGRNASIATRRVIDQIVQNENEEQNNHHGGGGVKSSSALSNSNSKQKILNEIVQRILTMFQSPTNSMDYLCSKQFAQDLFTLCKSLNKVLEREPRCVFISSPCYVFGDIHGNIEDLHFFSDNLWKLGMSLAAGNFLFLGDYVDRGLNCLETIAYLFAMKFTLPNKVFLLRGNHETRDVNGWEEHYHERSFIYQCRYRFGNDIGYRIWEACNSVFDRLPLAAIIDQDIFCVHGGIPRPIVHPKPNTSFLNVNNRNINTPITTTSRIQDILSVPKVAGINPPYEHEDDQYQQVASDCIWSDPASEQQEMYSVDPKTGYGESLRGGGAICFGHTAVTNFLQEHSLSYIMRAHEAHAEGVAISKGARVFTVFSTSQDHNQGSNAMAGCILVDNAKLQVINRSPACKLHSDCFIYFYFTSSHVFQPHITDKNQYVHRRDSVSVTSLSEQEIQRRMQLGFITPSLGGNTVVKTLGANTEIEVDQKQSEEWQDIIDEEVMQEAADGNDDDPTETESSMDDNQNPYLLDTRRRSSIDLGHLSFNMHDESVLLSSTSSGKEIVSDSTNQHSNKRLRYRQPSIASISEEEQVPTTENNNGSLLMDNGDDDDDEEEEVATVDGNDDEDIMEDI